jgi:hypothetical protein
MTTLDFTSTSADGLRQSDDPLISVTTILANLGTHPAGTIPLISGETPDVSWTWDHLEEPAEFFGMTMPSRVALRSAWERFAASAAAGTGHSLVAATIMLIEANGQAQFVITGVPARRFDPTPVRLAVSSDVSWPAPSATDPSWRRMAARTTSRGGVDQLQRWCAGNGFVDVVNRHGGPGASTVGPPALGALVFDHGNRLVGLDNPYPVSILGLLRRYGGAGMSMGHTEFVAPEPVASAWWISPLFAVHPVDRIGDARFQVEFGVPPTFLEGLS